jgi:signal transduction histidine kinase
MSTFIELEKQRNVTKAKTIAFAQAAHEFRNPLNGIIASLDVLENSITDHSGRHYY